MTRDEAYERMVTRLEAKHASSVAAIARAAVKRGGDSTENHDRAYEAVFDALIRDDDFESVAAVDISDIAYEAATRAVSYDETMI